MLLEYIEVFGEVETGDFSILEEAGLRNMNLDPSFHNFIVGEHESFQHFFQVRLRKLAHQSTLFILLRPQLLRRKQLHLADFIDSYILC